MLFRICPRTRRSISIYTIHRHRPSILPRINTPKYNCSSTKYTRRNSDGSSCNSCIIGNIRHHQWTGGFRFRWVHPWRREWNWTRRNRRGRRSICERSERVQSITFTQGSNRAISSHLNSPHNIRCSSYTVPTTRMEPIPVIEARRRGVSVRVQTTVQGVRVGPAVVPPPPTVRRRTRTTT